MSKAGSFDSLFNEINHQISAHHIIIKKGAIVDTNVIDTHLKPKGRKNFYITKDQKDENEVKVDKVYLYRVDKDASWLKKLVNKYMAIEKHYLTDVEGVVLGVVTTKTSTNEISNL
ncbi:MAG: IS5/IS1182 family transposase, partial [Psychroflexus sp.]|nr:IS5/IS1182 family transposase [Psychroflexus sp.]